MKKSDLFYTIAIAALVVLIIAVALFKFVILERNPQETFQVKGFEEITVIDLNGSEITLPQLMTEDQSTYCVMFRITDCFSCVFESIQELIHLRKSGKACIGLIIHDRLDEVSGFTANYEFSPFFMITRVAFYEHFKSPITPVLAKIQNNKVESYRYFTPH